MPVVPKHNASNLTRNNQEEYKNSLWFHTHQILVHGKQCVEEPVILLVTEIDCSSISIVPQRERKA